MINNQIYYYMLVTNDKLELPLTAPLTVSEMAIHTGLSKNTIRNQCANWYKTHYRKIVEPYKIVRFLVENIDDD